MLQSVQVNPVLTVASHSEHNHRPPSECSMASSVGARDTKERVANLRRSETVSLHTHTRFQRERSDAANEAF